MISDVVNSFAERMQSKLDKNIDKRGWEHCSDAYLLDRVLEEFHELKQAVVTGNVEEIKNEAADLANFAMMVFDNAGKEKMSRREAMVHNFKILYEGGDE